jgi:dsRNA-specific ribonuclease
MSFLGSDVFKEIKVYHAISPCVLENVKYVNGDERVTFVSEPFTGVPSDDSGSILFIDTIWSVVDTNQEFPFQSMKVNDKPLEYWIEVSKNCNLIVINQPPTYLLKPVAGFSYDNIVILDNFGRPMIKTCHVIPLSHNDWKKDLKEYIQSMLTKVDIKNVDRYVTPKHMSIWIKAFTHKSVSRSKNYEEYEIIGDSLLKSHMTLYLFEKYPNISAHHITGLRNYYLTKHYMPSIARKYNMLKHIRSLKPVNQDMLEDVLESFFGALYTVGNNITSCSFGVNKKMADYIFDDIDIDMTRGEGDPKSIVRLRTFQRLHLENPVEILERDGKLQCMTLSIDTSVREFFTDKGIVLNKTLGVGYGYTKTIASDMAYANALTYIRKKNIDEKFVQITTEQMKFGSIPLYQEVRDKYIAEGFVGIKIKPEISSQGKMMPLLATDDYYIWDYILATYMVTGDCDDTDIYGRLFQMYLSSADTREEPEDMSDRSRMELYQLAKEKGLTVNKKTTKDELCSLLSHNSVAPL